MSLSESGGGWLCHGNIADERSSERLDDGLCRVETSSAAFEYTHSQTKGTFGSEAITVTDGFIYSTGKADIT